MQEKRKKELYRRMHEMQVEQEKKTLAKQLMDPDAYERLMNVRVANYELYSQLLEMLISMARGNRIKGKITEAQLREILAKMTARPDSKIEFKHK
jgi:programmed cell death protein 5